MSKQKPKPKVESQANAKGEATKEQMQAKANEVKQLYRKTVEGIVEAGKVLRSFEEQIVSRCFKSFITEHLHWSRTQVYRIMWVYDRFAECNKLEHFDLSALYALSAPRCPQEATDDAIVMAKSDKYVTHKIAQELIAKYAQPAHPAGTRTRSVLISKAALRKAAKTRKIDVDKLVAVLKDVGINVKWEEDATKNSGEAA